jgi:hypothetical protein
MLLYTYLARAHVHTRDLAFLARVTAQLKGNHICSYQRVFQYTPLNREELLFMRIPKSNWQSSKNIIAQVTNSISINDYQVTSHFVDKIVLNPKDIVARN